MARKTIRNINPFTGKTICTIEETSPADVRRAVANAHEAQRKWAAMSVKKRLSFVEPVISAFAAAESEIAPLITAETGKPIREARGEVGAAQRRVNHICSRAQKMLGHGPKIGDENCTGTVIREPLGVAGVITAWNYPVSVSSQVIASALLAGNTVVFKASEMTPLCGRKLVELWASHLPENVIIGVEGAEGAGRALVTSDIDVVAFVGSCEVGKAIMRASATKLHRLGLELGGIDPAIVCHDADLERVAKRMIGGALWNCGQECNSIERIYVDRRVEKEFLKLLVAEVKKLKIGDPMKETTEIGPMISARQRKIVEDHVNDALRHGAKALTGGKRPKRRGFFYPPTVLANVDQSMRVIREETFGPVIPVVPFTSEEQAISWANDTRYGLTAGVWSRDIAHAKRLAKRLEAGIRAVNGTGGAHPLFPWGGAKESGLGRLMGPDPFAEFTDERSLIVYG